MGKSQVKDICPICQQDNHCDVQNLHQCWCMTVTIPHQLIAMLTEDLKGKQCICKKCITEYKV